MCLCVVGGERGDLWVICEVPGAIKITNLLPVSLSLNPSGSQAAPPERFILYSAVSCFVAFSHQRTYGGVN